MYITEAVVNIFILLSKLVSNMLLKTLLFKLYIINICSGASITLRTLLVH